jgi:thioesterase domain-containing protein/acyl carrier protein
LLPTGKVDRRNLEQHDISAATALRGPQELVAPRTPAEELMAAIWAETLKREQVGVEDNFFDLGGHSLLAVRLMARLEQLTGKRLPVSVLFQEPTVENLARLLRGDAPLPARSPVVPIQPHGSKPAIFWIHAAGGNVFGYQALARQLEDQPSYGVQAPGLDGDEAPFTTIEAMAAHYVEEIRKVQPAGPYRLGGWSMGGVVAFEMARQLAAQGEKVDRLLLLDSQRPTPQDRLSAGDNKIQLESFAREMGLLLGRLPIDWVHVLELSAEEQLDHVLEQAKAAGMFLSDLGLPQVRRLFEIFKTNTRALVGYTAQPYAGRIHLLRASDPPPAPVAQPGAGLWRRMNVQLRWLSELARLETVKLFMGTMKWRGLAAVEVGLVPGDHFTMLQPPHVEKLAAAITARLADAQPKGAKE